MKFASSLVACAGSLAAVFTAPFTVHSVEAGSPPVAAPAQTGAFGTIKGRLVYKGEAPELPKITSATQEFCKDQTLLDKALEVDPKTKGIANAFVYLNAPKGKNAAAEKALIEKHASVQIDNKNCEFVPRVMAMHKGQSLDFTSSDPVGHNSHFTGFSQGKNVALAPKGKVTEKLQAEKRPIPLNCDIHPWMKGWIMVFDHPFFAVTDAEGNFEITGVPAGAQNVVVWQEKVGYVTEGQAKGKAVEVKAGETLDIGDVTLDPSKVKK